MTTMTMSECAEVLATEASSHTRIQLIARNNPRKVAYRALRNRMEGIMEDMITDPTHDSDLAKYCRYLNTCPGLALELALHLAAERQLNDLTH